MSSNAVQKDLPLARYVKSLEIFAASRGAAVTRAALPGCVCGRASLHGIVLRRGLSPAEEFATLVHELTHVMVHARAATLNRTVCEYEAEAVEQWLTHAVRARALHTVSETVGGAAIDGLLAASVVRVKYAAHQLLNYLQAQPAIEIEAATGEEIVFHDEFNRACDLFGPS
jgi:hypothetical protein